MAQYRLVIWALPYSSKELYKQYFEKWHKWCPKFSNKVQEGFANIVNTHKLWKWVKYIINIIEYKICNYLLLLPSPFFVSLHKISTLNNQIFSKRPSTMVQTLMKTHPWFIVRHCFRPQIYSDSMSILKVFCPHAKWI